MKVKLSKNSSTLTDDFLPEYAIHTDLMDWGKLKSNLPCFTLKYWSSAILRTVTQLIAIGFIYAFLWGLEQKNALPGSPIFALLVMLLWCTIGASVFTFLMLPQVLGTLLMGFVYRNFAFPSFYEDIPVKWIAAIRNASLVVILLRAGLNLDLQVLKKIKYTCLRLSTLPCIVEGVIIALVSHYLFTFPWAWDFALGFIMAGLAPAIVVPAALDLEKEGIGIANGLTTLLIACSSLDDLVSITGIGMSVGMAFSKRDSVVSIITPLLEAIIGFIYGAVAGIAFWYFPRPSNDFKTFYRVLLLNFGGLAIYFIGSSLSFNGAGPIGSLSLGFFVALKWNKEPDKNVYILRFEKGFWTYLQILLFGLIGAEVDVSELEDDIAYGCLLLFIGVSSRLVTAFAVLTKSGYKFKEKLFILCCWIPKATVQAAMGSIVLDSAMDLNLEDKYVMYGEKIMTLSVVAILMTAPIGAILISVAAVLLLKKDEPPMPQENQMSRNDQELSPSGDLLIPKSNTSDAVDSSLSNSNSHINASSITIINVSPGDNNGLSSDNNGLPTDNNSSPSDINGSPIDVNDSLFSVNDTSIDDNGSPIVVVNGSITAVNNNLFSMDHKG